MINRLIDLISRADGNPKLDPLADESVGDRSRDDIRSTKVNNRDLVVSVKISRRRTEIVKIERIG